MTLDELLLEWSYRTKKGYPCLDNPSDIKILKTILERLNIPSEDILDELEDEKTYGNKDGEPGVAGMENSPSEVEPENDKSFSKEDLILLIKSTSISDQDAAKLAAQIQDLETSNPIKKYLELKAKESNIPNDQIKRFSTLLRDLEIQDNFFEYIKNPVDFNLSAKNFTDLISVIPSNKLKILYRKMVTTIVGNVSIGPGEILFSILFKNVKKRDSKGDLDIGDKNVEIKASIGGEKFAELEKSADAGAVVAKGYGRGSWSGTKKTGKFEEFIDGLGMSEENTDDAIKILTKSLKWPIKIVSIYDIFTKSENFEKQKFINGFAEVLKRIYYKNDFVPEGKYFNINKYFTEQDFNYKEFEIDIAKELVFTYKEYEQFSGMLYLNRNGDMTYLEGEDVISKIGTEIVITSFSDDVPRLLFKGHLS